MFKTIVDYSRIKISEESARCELPLNLWFMIIIKSDEINHSNVLLFVNLFLQKQLIVMSLIVGIGISKVTWKMSVEQYCI